MPAKLPRKSPVPRTLLEPMYALAEELLAAQKRPFVTAEEAGKCYDSNPKIFEPLGDYLARQAWQSFVAKKVQHAKPIDQLELEGTKIDIEPFWAIPGEPGDEGDEEEGREAREPEADYQQVAGYLTLAELERHTAMRRAQYAADGRKLAECELAVIVARERGCPSNAPVFEFLRRKPH